MIFSWHFHNIGKINLDKEETSRKTCMVLMLIFWPILDYNNCYKTCFHRKKMKPFLSRINSITKAKAILGIHLFNFCRNKDTRDVVVKMSIM